MAGDDVMFNATSNSRIHKHIPFFRALKVSSIGTNTTDLISEPDMRARHAKWPNRADSIPRSSVLPAR